MQGIPWRQEPQDFDDCQAPFLPFFWPSFQPGNLGAMTPVQRKYRRGERWVYVFAVLRLRWQEGETSVQSLKNTRLVYGEVGLWGRGQWGGGFHLYGVTLELIKEVELSDEGCMFRTWEEGMKTERMGRKSYSVDKQITEWGLVEAKRTHGSIFYFCRLLTLANHITSFSHYVVFPVAAKTCR